MTARVEHIAVRKTARLYTLGDAQNAEDAWIVCHGYGQLAHDFIRPFEKLVAPGRVIVAPEGLHRFYVDPPPAPAAQRRVAATWMTREDRDADISDNVAYLDAVAAHVQAARTKRVRALGFSQGGATVFRWAVLGVTRIDELILWSGEVPHDVDMRRAAERLETTRIILVQGARDRLASAERHMDALRTAGISFDLREHSGGHHLDSTLLTILADHG